MTLTYGAIDYGERNGIDSRKGMKGFYRSMEGADIPSFFKVGIITRASSVTHSCGERLREPERGDASHARKLFCPRCKVWTDRDVNASVILSDRGLARLASDLPPEEAARLLQEGKGPSALLLRVDGGKVTISR
jgi:hypothetical protein